VSSKLIRPPDEARPGQARENLVRWPVCHHQHEC